MDYTAVATLRQEQLRLNNPQQWSTDWTRTRTKRNNQGRRRREATRGGPASVRVDDIGLCGNRGYFRFNKYAPFKPGSSGAICPEATAAPSCGNATVPGA